MYNRDIKEYINMKREILRKIKRKILSHALAFARADENLAEMDESIFM